MTVARIRSIKPSFFTSEDVANVSVPARLLFVGLWTEADKRGRLEYRPKQIKARLFPHDEIDIEALLGEIQDAGLIQVYEVESAEVDYIAIPTWDKHQRVHPKEPESDCPEPPKFVKPGKKPARREKPGDIPSGPVGREGKGRDGDLGRGGSEQRGGAGILSSAAFANLQRFNAYVGARLRVPHKLHSDFVAVLGGKAPDADLRAFYAALDEEIEASGESIVPDIWKWLEARFRPWAKQRADDAEMAKFLSGEVS